MEIVKKNLVSIICGVVALFTLVAVFVWPLDGYYETLQEKAKKRADVQGKVNGLLSKSRNLPVFDPNNPTGSRLSKFPSQQIITIGSKAVKGEHQISDKTYTEAIRLNESNHPLVIANILPNPISQVAAINFRGALQERLDKLRTEDLAAGVPPTDREVEERKDALWKSMENEIIKVNGEPSQTSLDQVMARYLDRAGKLKDEMKKEMATKNKVYVDPSVVMAVSPTLPVNSAPSREAIWWAQVNFWVTADVVAAIRDVNAKSTSVSDSPVKNLLALQIPDDFFPPMAGLAAGGGGRGESTSADASATPAGGGLPDPTLTIPDGAAQTPTRRISNNLYDVVQFKLAVDVEADKVPLFLKTLATNRFITVTRFEMNPVDSQLMQIRGYVYGPRPVVTLNLDCEELFLRAWTYKLMPASIRTALGIPVEGQQGQPAAPVPAPAPAPVRNRNI